MSDDVKTCQGCGASIYREHLDRGMAGFTAGKLLCAVCRNQALGIAPEPPVAAAAPARVADPSEDTIRLVDDAEMTTRLQRRGGSGGGASPGGSVAGDTRLGMAPAHDEFAFSRPLSKGHHATRCRTFHAKLSEGALHYLDEQLNEWSDRNPEIEIKFATQTVGIFEGKHSSEQHLILTVFY